MSLKEREHYPVSIILSDHKVSFQADPDEYLLYEALRAGVEWPRACDQGWCLACAARIIEGAVDHSGAYLYYPEDLKEGFVLMCSAKPCSPLTLSHDPHQTRREIVQHRLEKGLLTKAYPKPGWRRGPAKGE
ncbi:2Fe-2S iron-sulfur cluster binding domain-containing protein [Bacillus sp. PK3_68]|uniref:2Fe-2S iron-sulfur cluster-binding protein n=1 Tax=Bacillus sp. PK3_68 TaxID=2027408 RepID=UPI001C7DF7EE|nr:2Fe-2S iron-sulfur cluster binding domain-containing protein [Bacillus sp. PK3_68]